MLREFFFTLFQFVPRWRKVYCRDCKHATGNEPEFRRCRCFPDLDKRFSSPECPTEYNYAQTFNLTGNCRKFEWKEEY